MRRLLPPLVAALLAAAPLASAGPLDPRGPDAVQVWLVERVSAAAPAWMPVSFDVRNERSTLFTVAFERHDGVRDFHDAQYTGFFLYPAGGGYPRVRTEYGGTPDCPAEVACSEPAGTTYGFNVGFGMPSLLSLYLVTTNVTVHPFTVPAGWTVTALPASSAGVHMVRTGTGIDTNVVGGIDHFTDASFAARGPSLAIAVIPCLYGLSGPAGPGAATLDGGGPMSTDLGPYDDRHPRCEGLEIGRAANDAATTWHLHGEATGLLAAPFHLVVVELPTT
jgi:hypothetical protein